MKHTLSSKTLPNKASIHIIDVPDSSVVETRLVFDAGFNYFNEQTYHIPHLLEHLLIGHGGAYKNETKFLRALQDLGAQANAETDYEHITVMLRAPKDNFVAAFSIILDCVFNTTFDDEVLEKQREIVIREIYEQFDSLGAQVINTALGLHFGGLVPKDWESHLEHVNEFALKDLLKAYKKYIRPENVQIFVSGGLADKDKVKLEKLVGKVDAPWPFSKLTRINVKESPPTLEGMNADLGDGAGLNLVFISPIDKDESHKSRVAASFAVQLLFNAPSAVIPLKLRERGIVYSVNTDVTIINDESCVMVNIFAHPDRIHLAALEVIKYLHLYASGNIELDEFASVKRFTESLIPTSYETVGDLIDWYSVDILKGRGSVTIQQEVEVAKELTVEEVAAATKHLFVDAKLYGAIASPDAESWTGVIDEFRSDLKDSESEQQIEKRMAQITRRIKELRAVKDRRSLGWVAYFVLQFFAWISALFIAQLPLIGSDQRVSAWQYATEYNMIWGLFFFVPFGLAGLLTFVRGKKERAAETGMIILDFIAAIAYGAGILFFFGDVGADNQPWWEDAASIAQPLFFFVAAPLAVVAIVRERLRLRRIAHEYDSAELQI